MKTILEYIAIFLFSFCFSYLFLLGLDKQAEIEENNRTVMQQQDECFTDDCLCVDDCLDDNSHLNVSN